MKGNLLRAVRSALARPPAAPLSAHPDPDLLAAFAENTLLVRERAEIAGHLAGCADCREFLALAFGAEFGEPAVVAPSRPARRWSPVWNWAASMATICIVVSAVWEFRAQQATPLERPPGPPAINAPAPASPSPNLQHAAPKSAPVKTVANGAMIAAQGAAPPVAAPEAAPPAQTPPPAAQMEPRSSPPQQAATPPPPPPPQEKKDTSDALAAIPAPPGPQVSQSSESVMIQGAAPQGLATRAKTSQGSMKSAVGGAAGQNRFGVMSRAAAARQDMPAGPTVLWTIAASQQRGIVQRSRDGGATWETVPLSEQTGFRAVASAGADVWAGGSGGALFHSTDSGAHWNRVETGVTDTIVEIRPGGAGAAVVTTDAGHTLRLTDTQR